MEGEEAAKAFQVIKDDREALFKKLKDRKGGKGGKFGMRKKAPKNKKITFDDDEPAEKKVKGTCSKTFFRANAFEPQILRVFSALWRIVPVPYLLEQFFSFVVPTWY